MNKKLINILNNGGVAVIPTDTIYGVVGQALSEDTVEKIYQIKGRRPEKPFIILISDVNQLKDFGVDIKKDVGKYWPGPNSLIFKTTLAHQLSYLTRGGETLAFRLPDNDDVRGLIKETGPLVAPSANPEGLEPAQDIKKAKEYFGDKVDYYLDVGELIGASSSLYDMSGKTTIKIR